MAYQIDITTLIELIKPWDKSYSQGCLVNVAMDKQALDRLYYHKVTSKSDFEQEMLSFSKDIVRCAVEEKMNNKMPIHLNMHQKDPDTWLSVADRVSFMGAILREDEFIWANVSGEWSEAILGLKPESAPSTVKALIPEENIIWDNIKAASNIMNDVDSVLEKIQLFSAGTLKSLFSSIDHTLWDNDEFIAQIISSGMRYFQYMNDSVFYYEKFSQKVISDNALFSSAWYKCYKNNYNIEVLENNEQTMHWENNTVVSNNINSVNNIEKVNQLITQHVLNDKSRVIALIKAQKSFSLYEIAPDDIKIDNDVLQAVHDVLKEHKYKSNIYESLPEWYWADEKNVKNIVRLFLPFAASQDTKLFNSWIGSKEKIIEYAQMFPNPSVFTTVERYYNEFGLLYPKLSEEFKKDPEIVALFVARNHELYLSLPQELKEQWIVLKSYLDKNISFKLENIPEKTLESLEGLDCEWVIQIMPLILNSDKCPVSWRQEIKYLPLIAYHPEFLNIKILPEVWARACQSDEMCQQLLEKNIYIYKMLTIEGKYQPSSLKVLAQNSAFIVQNLELIPQDLWGQDEFVLDVLKQGALLAYAIKKHMWSNKNFFFKLCHEIDEGMISQNVFNYAPVNIKNIIDSLKISKGNYEATLSKYLLQHKLAQELNIKDLNAKISKI